MKKSLVIFGICFLFVFIMIGSFVSAEIDCKDLGYECGIWEDNPEIYGGGTTDCGTCSEGVCIVGKCYSSEKSGKCALPSFGSGTISLLNGKSITLPNGESPPCDFWSGDSLQMCENYGCAWNDETSICSGDSKNCDDLTLNECTSKIGFLLNCVLDGSFSKKLYWTGTNFLKDKNLKELQNGETIPITIAFVDFDLDNGAAVNFDIYYFDWNKYSQLFVSDPTNSSAGKNWFEKTNPIELRKGNDALQGFVNENKEVTVQWDLSIEDLNKINYNGNAYFFVEVSLNDKTKIISAQDYEPLIGSFAVVNDEPVSMLNLPPQLTRNRFGTITSVEYPFFTSFNLATLTEYCDGTLPCNTFTSESQCDFASREAKSLSDAGLITNDNFCFWNKASSSCEGEQGISCMILNQNECNQIKECSWKKYGLWQRFLDWMSSLFG